RIERAIRQVSAGLVDLPQGGDVRMDGIRVPVRAGCGARRRVRGSVRGALGDVRAGRCRRRTGGARGGEDAARGARIDRAERGQGGAAIRGRVAQETQIRSVQASTAAHTSGNVSRFAPRDSNECPASRITTSSYGWVRRVSSSRSRARSQNGSWSPWTTKTGFTISGHSGGFRTSGRNRGWSGY